MLTRYRVSKLFPVGPHRKHAYCPKRYPRRTVSDGWIFRYATPMWPFSFRPFSRRRRRVPFAAAAVSPRSSRRRVIREPFGAYTLSPPPPPPPTPPPPPPKRVWPVDTYFSRRSDVRSRNIVVDFRFPAVPVEKRPVIFGSRTVASLDSGKNRRWDRAGRQWQD